MSEINTIWESDNGKKMRYFKVVDPDTGATYGVFSAETAKEAVDKLLSKNTNSEVKSLKQSDIKSLKQSDIKSLKQSDIKSLKKPIDVNSDIKSLKKPNDVISEKKPNGVYSEKKSNDVYSEKKTNDIYSEIKSLKKTNDIYSEIKSLKKTNDVISEKKPNDVISEKKPNDIYSEKKPNDVISEKKPNDVITEKKPNDVNIKGGKEDKTRYFKIIDTKTGKTHGRYTGMTPKQAASKAFTQMVKVDPTINTTNIKLKESTRGSTGKTYLYQATRVKLDRPQTLQIGSGDNAKTITYEYRHVIKKIDK